MTGAQQLPDRELEQALRAWLDEGVVSLSDRIVDALVQELPHTPQRRRTGLGGLTSPGARPALALAATLALLLVTGVALWLGSRERVEPTPTWRVLPSDEVPLEPGSYVVGPPFPIRIGMTVADGWGSNPVRATYAEVRYIGGDAGRAALFFTFVEGVYTDPCHLEQGFIDPPVGPGVDDLATALASLPVASVSGPADTTVGGHAAVTLTLTAPSAFEGCTGASGGPPYRLWGVPEWGAVAPGTRLRLWIVAVGGERLVIGAEEFSDASPEALAALNTLIASLKIEPAGAIASAPPLRNILCDPCSSLPPSGPLLERRYALFIRLQRYAGGTPIPLEEPHRLTFDGHPDWSSTGDGIVTTGAPAGGGARFNAWSVARIYRDPCRWQTSAYGSVGPSELGTLNSLANSLWQWWAPGAPVRPGYQPPPLAPAASQPIDETRSGNFARKVVLTLPPDLEVAACDGGEYRIWEDFGGRARIAYGPGERIRLWVVDLAPGLLVIDASTLPETSHRDHSLLDGWLFTVWVERPEDYAGQ